LQNTLENAGALEAYLEVSASYNWSMWNTKTSNHGDPNGETSTPFSTAINNVLDNAKSRIDDLQRLISEKQYK
jgi:hypothetical protein